MPMSERQQTYLTACLPATPSRAVGGARWRSRTAAIPCKKGKRMHFNIAFPRQKQQKASNKTRLLQIKIQFP
jgi:hypothetical protein